MDILSKKAFMESHAMLDEGCRQWYAFIQEDDSRMDGEGFGAFYQQLCDEKYEEYRQEPENFSFGKPQYPIFLALNEEEAQKLAGDLADHVRCMRDSGEGNPLKSVYNKLTDQMSTAEQISEEGMGMEL